MPSLTTAPATNPKILVVDDDPEMRLALQVRLKANHYDVSTAVDGVSAISETRRVTPDLMLLDLGLPAGDGFSVLQRLKANSASSPSRSSSSPAATASSIANVPSAQALSNSCKSPSSTRISYRASSKSCASPLWPSLLSTTSARRSTMVLLPPKFVNGTQSGIPGPIVPF